MTREYVRITWSKPYRPTLDATFVGNRSTRDANLKGTHPIESTHPAFGWIEHTSPKYTKKRGSE